jgi:hypothetical protein
MFLHSILKLSRQRPPDFLVESFVSGSGLENLEYGHGDPLRRPRVTLYLQKLALTSQTSDCLLGWYSSVAY